MNVEHEAELDRAVVVVVIQCSPPDEGLAACRIRLQRS